MPKKPQRTIIPIKVQTGADLIRQITIREHGAILPEDTGVQSLLVHQPEDANVLEDPDVKRYLESKPL